MERLDSKQGTLQEPELICKGQNHSLARTT